MWLCFGRVTKYQLVKRYDIHNSLIVLKVTVNIRYEVIFSLSNKAFPQFKMLVISNKIHVYESIFTLVMVIKK